jgi:hypothetical protein
MIHHYDKDDMIISLVDSVAGIGHAPKGTKFKVSNNNMMLCLCKDNCGYWYFGPRGYEADFNFVRKPIVIVNRLGGKNKK